MFRNSMLATSLLIVIATIAAAQAAPQALTNDDVIAMSKAGLEGSTIVSAIQSQDTNFDISARGLLQLKKAGVPPKVMDAVITAAGKRKAADEAAANAKAKADEEAKARAEANAKAVAVAPAVMSPTGIPGQPSVSILQGGQKQAMPLSHTQIVQTKTKASTLGALASDGTLVQGMAGLSQSVAAAGMMKGSTKFANTAMMANPMVGGAMMAGSLFSHRKPTVTNVWALPGTKSETVIHNPQPAFEVHCDNIPGVNADEFEPVLLKLESTPNNFRIVGATEAKQDALQAATADWGMYSSFVEERIPAQTARNGSGNYQLQASSPLPPGEYAVALRPISKDKKFSGSSVSQNTGDGLVFNSVWSFEVQ